MLGRQVKERGFLDAPKPDLVDFCLYVGPALSTVAFLIFRGFALSGLLHMVKSTLKNIKWKMAEINNLCFKLFNIFSYLMKSLTFPLILSGHELSLCPMYPHLRHSTSVSVC